jgi:hypothetical protein
MRKRISLCCATVLLHNVESLRHEFVLSSYEFVAYVARFFNVKWLHWEHIGAGL